MIPLPDDGKVSFAAHVHEVYGAGPAGWCVFYCFLYNGESYDYFYDLGPAGLTEKQARDVSKRVQCLHRARGNFLRDVDLVGAPHDVELHSAHIRHQMTAQRYAR